MKIQKTSLLISLMCIVTTLCFGQESAGQINQTDSTYTARALVSFTVNLDGSITKVKIKKFECNECSKEDKKNYQKEVIRVVKATPNMGKHKEKTRYLLPINLKTEN